jgi:hypothetical protein
MHSPARGDSTVALTLAPRTAAAAVLVLWVPYTVYFAVDRGSVPGALLGLAPGVLGVGLLLAAGFGPAECFHRPAALSRAGGAALAGVAVLLVPIVASGRGVGWDWLGVLVLAPLSGVSQELYFRSSLLPALLDVCGGHRAALALALHGVLFTLWHLRTLVLMPPPVAALTCLVLLLAGLGWGWQTLRDQTVVWAMGQHTLFLMAMAFFGFG